MAEPTVLDLKVPPALLGAVIALGMWGVSKGVPDLAPSLPMLWTLVPGVGLGILGVTVILSGVTAFRRHGTTVDPIHPEAASHVVRTGIYRHTRNPMYVGFSIGLLGWAVALGNPLALLGVPAFMAYLNRFQIHPEERALRAKFGEDYETYVRDVRRWL